MRGFQPRKWKMDVETKIEEDQLKKKVESRMKEFGAGTVRWEQIRPRHEDRS